MGGLQGCRKPGEEGRQSSREASKDKGFHPPHATAATATTTTRVAREKKSLCILSKKFNNLKSQFKRKHTCAISKDILIPFEMPIKKPLREGVKT